MQTNCSFIIEGNINSLSLIAILELGSRQYLHLTLSRTQNEKDKPLVDNVLVFCSKNVSSVQTHYLLHCIVLFGMNLENNIHHMHIENIKTDSVLLYVAGLSNRPVRFHFNTNLVHQILIIS